uniref:Uncharacterized protein n=1 Tax=Sphaerodactylus townsendi TaxID=933632 RepID=A0ACB8G7B8_9SAUR
MDTKVSVQDGRLTAGNQQRFRGQRQQLCPAGVLIGTMKACFAWNCAQGSPGPPDEEGLPAAAPGPAAAEEEEEEEEEEAAQGAPPAPGAAGPPPAEPPPAPFPPPAPEQLLGRLRQELEDARLFQAQHRRERAKDARSCRGCVRSAVAVEAQLEALRDRLDAAEARLAPPRPDAAP